MRIERKLLCAKNSNLRVGLVLHSCQRHHGYVSITMTEAKNTSEHLHQTFSLTSIYFYFLLFLKMIFTSKDVRFFLSEKIFFCKHAFNF